MPNFGWSLVHTVGIGIMNYVNLTRSPILQLLAESKTPSILRFKYKSREGMFYKAAGHMLYEIVQNIS